MFSGQFFLGLKIWKSGDRKTKNHPVGMNILSNLKGNLKSLLLPEMPLGEKLQSFVEI